MSPICQKGPAKTLVHSGDDAAQNMSLTSAAAAEEREEEPDAAPWQEGAIARLFALNGLNKTCCEEVRLSKINNGTSFFRPCEGGTRNVEEG